MVPTRALGQAGRGHGGAYGPGRDPGAPHSVTWALRGRRWLAQGELEQGEAAAARGPLPRAAGPHRIANTHGSPGAGRWVFHRDSACSVGSRRRGPLRSGPAMTREARGRRCPHGTAVHSVSSPGAVGLTPRPGCCAEPQAEGWTGRPWLALLDGLVTQGRPQPAVHLFGLSAGLLPSGFRQTEPSFWVRICLFNLDKNVLTLSVPFYR